MRFRTGPGIPARAVGSGAGAAVCFHNIYSGNYPPFQATALHGESDYGMERSAGTEAAPWVGLLSSPLLNVLCSEQWGGGIARSVPNPTCSPRSISVHCAALGVPTSQNHGMVGLEGTSRITKLQPPHHTQGHQPPHFRPAQAAHGPIQPGLQHLQGWTGHPQPLWAAVQHLPTLIVKNFPSHPTSSCPPSTPNRFPSSCCYPPFQSCLPSCL